MDTKQKLSIMKDSLKKTQDNYIRNKGVFDSKLQELKKDFDYNNLDEAKEALTKMKKKSVVMQKRLDESVSDFEEKYKDLLE
jgi:acyl carrier protein phosphodiesterase